MVFTVRIAKAVLQGSSFFTQDLRRQLQRLIVAARGHSALRQVALDGNIERIDHKLPAPHFISRIKLEKVLKIKR